MYLCRFLCALQPHDRKKWAQRYAQLIKPGGQLATLIFPVDPNKDRNEGPPFPVTPELYTELLEPLGTLSTHDCDASHSSGAIESGACFHAAFSALLRQARDCSFTEQSLLSACEACSTGCRRVLSRQGGHQMSPVINKLHCRAGFAQVHFRKVEPHESHERRQGQEYFAVWTRKAEA